MAISTYSELQTAVSNWAAGQLANARVVECIALAEAEISRVIYGNDTETRAQAVTTPGEARLALPSDCRRMRALRHVDTTGGAIQYLNPGAFDGIAVSGGGRPRFFTVEAGALRFSPAPDAEYTVEMIYQRGVSALSDDNTATDLLTRHPDLYLWGSLMHAFDFLMDEARAAKARERFAELAQEVLLENERTRFPTPLRMKSPYREVR